MQRVLLIQARAEHRQAIGNAPVPILFWPECRPAVGLPHPEAKLERLKWRDSHHVALEEG
eukprot:scaffold3920_cov262-Pinguiococcus_pyrenoidosus.AAC.11